MKENSVYINTIASLADDAGYFDLKDFYYDTINKKIVCYAQTLNRGHSDAKVQWTYSPNQTEIGTAFSSLSSAGYENKKWILRELKLIKLLES